MLRESRLYERITKVLIVSDIEQDSTKQYKCIYRIPILLNICVASYCGVLIVELGVKIVNILPPVGVILSVSVHWRCHISTGDGEFAIQTPSSTVRTPGQFTVPVTHPQRDRVVKLFRLLIRNAQIIKVCDGVKFYGMLITGIVLVTNARSNHWFIVHRDGPTSFYLN